MSLGPKNDVLVSEIREHVSLTDHCRVSQRQDRVFLSNLFIFHRLRIKNSHAIQQLGVVSNAHEVSNKCRTELDSCAGM